MIADTTFLIDLMQERRAGWRGPALTFLAEQRRGTVLTCVIGIGEVAVSFPTSADAWSYFRAFRIYPLHRGVVDAAADVDRELIRAGGRLGENDNWIAGFARYYREPVISRDEAFDRVRGLRRLPY
jgi:predicted nucleic acid-binding protein